MLWLLVDDAAEQVFIGEISTGELEMTLKELLELLNQWQLFME